MQKRSASRVPAGTQSREVRMIQGRRVAGRASHEATALVPGYSPLSLRDNRGYPPFVQWGNHGYRLMTKWEIHSDSLLLLG